MSGAIIRELVTVLGFKTNLKGIKDSEKALLSFQTKVALGVTAAAAALAKTLDFFGNIAQEALSTRDIADSTGIALNNLLGMGKAAEQFGLQQNDVNEIFRTLNSSIQQALFGQGDLAQLAAETGIEYKDNNGELLANEIILQNILRYLATIQDKQKQIQISSRIFGENLAAGVSRIASGLDKFNAAAERSAGGASRNISENVKALENYQTSLIGLNRAWADFVTELGITVFPALSFLINALETLVNLMGATFRNVPIIGKNLNAEILSDFGDEEGDEIQKRAREGTLSLLDFLIGPTGPAIQPAVAGNTTNNVTAQVQVNVPAGIEQPQQIGQYVADMVNAQLEYTINQIYNNNPQVE